MTLKKTLSFLTAIFFIFGSTFSQETEDSSKNENGPISDANLVIKIGSIPPVLIYRYAPMLTLSIDDISPVEIESKGESSILPVLKENIPGLFYNSQGVAGYGVSSGASGNITMRGFSGSAGRILILIDGPRRARRRSWSASPRACSTKRSQTSTAYPYIPSLPTGKTSRARPESRPSPV